MLTASVVIVGAGPAGMSAAIEAADAGADVVLLDENDRVGGQIYRQLPPQIRARTPLGDQAVALELLHAIASRPNIRVQCATAVWGACGGTTLAIRKDDRVDYVTGGCVIISTGALDRPVAFPGWTMPGVITAGAALTLLKGQRILPGRRVLLAGAGPIQLVLAKYLLRGGAKIVGLLEASSRWQLYRRLGRLLGQGALLREGIGYVLQLRRSGIRVRYGHAIARAEGDTRIQRAVITRVDEDWRPIAGSEKSLDVDAVVCGYGFVPSIELTSLLGCDHQYDPWKGGWVPTHNDAMETSVPGIFVAGETTGVAGAVVAREEGKIAGISAAHRLGLVTKAEADRRSRAPRRHLGGLYRFRRALDEVYRPREGLLDLLTPNTVVCRCEEVTTSAIVSELSKGARDVNDVKRRTRAGMGPCQGRMCATSVTALVQRHYGVNPADAERPSVRPPARPVALGAFAAP